MEWVNVIGLACDIAGAAVLAWGLFIDEDDALKLGLPPYVHGAEDEPDEHTRRQKNLALPAVQDRLTQSSRAKIGLKILVLGSVLQIVANWPS